MYFFKIEPLKKQLRDRTLTDREALPYLLIFTALMSLFPLGAPSASTRRAAEGDCFALICKLPRSTTFQIQNEPR